MVLIPPEIISRTKLKILPNKIAIGQEQNPPNAEATVVEEGSKEIAALTDVG